MTVPVPPPPTRAGAGRWIWVAVAAVLVTVLLVVLAVVGLRAALDAGQAAPEHPPTAPADEPVDEDAGGDPPPASPSPPAGSGDEPADEPAGGPGDGTDPPALDGPPPVGIEEIVEQISSLRGLTTSEPVDARVVPSEELGARFAELAFEDYDAEDLEHDGRLLTSLRLLEPEDDLRAVVEALYREQILGLYLVEDRVLYIGGEEPDLSAAQRITAAHEVLHALQDLAFDLDAFMDLDDRESDAHLARLALVEGDAMLTQELWSLRFQTSDERREAAEEAGGGSPGALFAAPAYVRESMLFPYQAGMLFVQALFAEGGFPAVDAAFADPPASTRHVLRPDTYLAGETHTGTDITTAPGEGWAEASTYTFGEFDVDQWLAPVGAARTEVTGGWDGGLTRHWTRGDDDAVALSLRLGTAAAGEAACRAVRDWYTRVAGASAREADVYEGDRDWMALRCDPEEVLVGLGPDAETATRLAGQRETSTAARGVGHYTGAGPR